MDVVLRTMAHDASLNTKHIIQEHVSVLGLSVLALPAKPASAVTMHEPI